MKPVGKPDAGNPHVRFDERGGETERCRKAPATAPLLDSTIIRQIYLAPIILVSARIEELRMQGVKPHAFLGIPFAMKELDDILKSLAR